MKRILSTVVGSTLAVGGLLSFSALEAQAQTFYSESDQYFTTGTEKIDDFLIIGLTNNGEGDSVNVSGGGNGDGNSLDQTSQLGADTEYLSNSGGLELYDVFSERYEYTRNNGSIKTHKRNGDSIEENIFSLVGAETILTVDSYQAANLGVGIDFSGEIAITSDQGDFNMSNTNIFADIGIQCSSSISTCSNSISGGNLAYLDPTVQEDANSGISRRDHKRTLKNSGAALKSNTSDPSSTSGKHGLEQVDHTDLLSELDDFEAFVRNAEATFTITQNILENYSPEGYKDGFNNQNIKDGNANNPFVFDVLNGTVSGGSGPVVFDLGSHDRAEHEFVFIDIDLDGNDFNLTNTDIIIDGGQNVTAIFRTLGGSNLVANQSSILLGDSGIGKSDPNNDYIDQIGAIFTPVEEDGDSGDTTLSFNDTVLNGIGLYDLSSFNESRNGNGFDSDEGNNVVNIQNGQGCAQFIGSKVQMSNVRFNKCSLVGKLTDLQPVEPEPIEIPEPGSLMGLALLGGGMLKLRRRNFS